MNYRLVNIAPDPVLAGFKRLDQGVLGGVKMFCRMFIGGIVAASNVPANQTDAQVNPAAADSKAVFTALSAWLDTLDLIQMGTAF